MKVTIITRTAKHWRVTGMGILPGALVLPEVVGWVVQRLVAEGKPVNVRII